MEVHNCEIFAAFIVAFVIVKLTCIGPFKFYMVVTSLVEQPYVQSFRGIWINFIVTNISTVHHKVEQNRSCMMLSMLQLYFIRTTDCCEETKIYIFPHPAAVLNQINTGIRPFSHHCKFSRIREVKLLVASSMFNDFAGPGGNTGCR